MAIPLDLALALVAARVAAEHSDPDERDRAADILRALESNEGSAGVTVALDATTQWHSWSSDATRPTFVDTSEWDDRDNG